MFDGLALESWDDCDAWMPVLATLITRAAINVEKTKCVFISITPRKVEDYSGSTVQALVNNEKGTADTTGPLVKRLRAMLFGGEIDRVSDLFQHLCPGRRTLNGQG